jgi:hypothetical protein
VQLHDYLGRADAAGRAGGGWPCHAISVEALSVVEAVGDFPAGTVTVTLGAGRGVSGVRHCGSGA